MTPTDHELSRPRLRGTLLFLLALLFAGTVATTLLVLGPFLWGVKTPAAWQGELEALVVMGLVFAALQWQRAPTWARALLFAVPLLLYLRRHHVDLALPVALLYLEGMVLLGVFVIRLLREDMQRSDIWLRGLITGIVAMSLLLWTAQAFDIGTPRGQRLLALVVLVPLLLWQWRHLQTPRMLRAAFSLQRPIERVWAAALIVAAPVLFARSNIVTGFDEIWYGLRPDRVLVGESSVFEPLGFVSPVYYFPKLYEVLLLPIWAMRENSATQGVTILVGGIIAMLAHAMLRRRGHTQAVALAGAALAWSIPALSNASVSVKPDVLVALCVVAMVWFSWNLLQHGRRADLCWVFACAGIAVSSKLIAYPYVGAAGLACLVGWWLQRAPVERDRGGMLAAWGVLGTATAVGVFVSVRTYVLTGMPTVGPEQLVSIWQALGMEFKPPVGTLAWSKPQVWSDVPAILLGWIANPSAFSHLQISWPGNVWVFLPLAALLLPRSVRERVALPPHWILWAVPAMGLLMLLVIRFSNRGGDGNYFIAPVVLATIAGMDLLWRRRGVERVERPLMAGLALFMVLHVGLSFVSAGWTSGTRTFDLDFSRSNRDTRERNIALLEGGKLSGVAQYLLAQHRHMRIAGDDDVAPHLGYRLPARYEGFNDMLWSQGGDSETRTSYSQLLGCARVEAFLLPVKVTRLSPYPAIAQVTALANILPPDRTLYQDEHWKLISVDGLLPACPEGTSVEAGRAPD